MRCHTSGSAKALPNALDLELRFIEFILGFHQVGGKELDLHHGFLHVTKYELGMRLCHLFRFDHEVVRSGPA